MQAGKSATASTKETAANITASAQSGLEKTKAVLEEKVERIATSDSVEKDMATLRKEEKIQIAELKKQEAYSQNAVAAIESSRSFTTTGSLTSDLPTKMSGHKTTAAKAQPTGYVKEDLDRSHYPIGTTAGVGGGQYPPGTNTWSGRAPVSGYGDPTGVGTNTGTGRIPILSKKTGVENPGVYRPKTEG